MFRLLQIQAKLASKNLHRSPGLRETTLRLQEFLEQELEPFEYGHVLEQIDAVPWRNLEVLCAQLANLGARAQPTVPCLLRFLGTPLPDARRQLVEETLSRLEANPEPVLSVLEERLGKADCEKPAKNRSPRWKKPLLLQSQQPDLDSRISLLLQHLQELPREYWMQVTRLLESVGSSVAPGLFQMLQGNLRQRFDLLDLLEPMKSPPPFVLPLLLNVARTSPLDYWESSDLPRKALGILKGMATEPIPSLVQAYLQSKGEERQTLARALLALEERALESVCGEGE